MQVTKHIHALRIPFQIRVTPERAIERIVYSYIVFGEKTTLIDSGVSGAEKIIFDYLEKNGREPKDISLLILSHSHPDHIGAAKAIQAGTGCTISAHPGEKGWIEDTDRQFRERPVPGFQTLVGGPVRIEKLLSDGEILELGKDIRCQVIHTPGHSRGSLSLYFEDENTVFSGDAVPLPNDLPIYEDIIECAKSMARLKSCQNVQTLLSSWEPPVQGREKVEKRMADGMDYLCRIHQIVLQARRNGKEDLMEMCRYVVGELGLPPVSAIPLVAKAFASSLKEDISDRLFHM